MTSIAWDLVIFGSLALAWRIAWKIQQDLSRVRQFKLRAEARRAELEQIRRGGAA